MCVSFPTYSYIYIYIYSIAGGNKGSDSRMGGFMMKLAGNLKSPIVEPESARKMEQGGKSRNVREEVEEEVK